MVVQACADVEGEVVWDDVQKTYPFAACLLMMRYGLNSVAIDYCT
jgi:hypothetical protein